MSRLFKLPQLETICINQRSEEDFLNPSIGTYLNDETGKRMKDIFLNKPLLADIAFNVEGKTSHLHFVLFDSQKKKQN